MQVWESLSPNLFETLHSYSPPCSTPTLSMTSSCLRLKLSSLPFLNHWYCRGWSPRASHVITKVFPMLTCFSWGKSNTTGSAAGMRTRMVDINNTRTPQQGYHSKDTTARTPQQGHHSKDTTARTPQQGHHSKDTTARTPQQGHHSKDTTARTPQQGHHSKDTTARTPQQGLTIRVYGRDHSTWKLKSATYRSHDYHTTTRFTALPLSP